MIYISFDHGVCLDGTYEGAIICSLVVVHLLLGGLNSFRFRFCIHVWLINIVIYLFGFNEVFFDVLIF